MQLFLLSNSRPFPKTPQRNFVPISMHFPFHHHPPHASVSTSGTLLYFLSLGFFCSGNFVQTDSYIMQISFTQRIFKLHLPCSLYYYFTPFYGLRILRCLDRTPFVYLFIIYSWADGQLGCFHLLAVVNNAAINHMCKFLCGHSFSFFQMYS